MVYREQVWSFLFIKCFKTGTSIEQLPWLQDQLLPSTPTVQTKDPVMNEFLMDIYTLCRLTLNLK